MCILTENLGGGGGDERLPRGGKCPPLCNPHLYHYISFSPLSLSSSHFFSSLFLLISLSLSSLSLSPLLAFSPHYTQKKIPYLLELKSQLQHIFLLLISRMRFILRMLRILCSISRTEDETSPVWAWSRTVVQRMLEIYRWNMHTTAHAC